MIHEEADDGHNDSEFDAQFPPLKAEFRASQEEFYILSRSEIR